MCNQNQSTEVRNFKKQQDQKKLIEDLKARKDQVTNHGISDPFEKDYARLVHSCFVRRLQAKTQIFSLNSCDFYRTRLTHSLEVSQLSMGILHHIKTSSTGVMDEKLLPCDLGVMSLGLAHDLGHPPFGHSGENMLNKCMYDACQQCFEGNAQNIRILTSLGEYQEQHGMNVTRRTLLGIIKYPISFSDAIKDASSYISEVKQDTQFPVKPPKCFYDDSESEIRWALEPFPKKLKEAYFSYDDCSDELNTSKKKTLDCSIMELADDISFAVHDLEDAIYLNMVQREDWQQEVVENIDCQFIENILKIKHKETEPSTIESITEYLFSKNTQKRKKGISRLVNCLVRSCKIESNPWAWSAFTEYQTIMHYNVKMDQDAKTFLEKLKKFILKHVVQSYQVRSFMFKGQKVIKTLFDTYFEHYEETMKKSKIEKLNKILKSAKNDHERSRIKAVFIRDYIAGMTDSYAIRCYDRLFTPAYDSMFDAL